MSAKMNVCSLLLFFTISVSTVKSALVKYGEICRMSENFDQYYYPDYSEANLHEDPDVCDFRNGKCINNKCQCQHPDKMVYNNAMNECGISLGHYCNESMDFCFEGNECIDNTCSCEYPREPIVIAAGSQLRQLNGSGPGDHAKCTSLRHEECEIDLECSSREFLSCFEGYCDCKSPMRAVYEEVLEDDGTLSKGCRIKAGESCTPLSQSISNISIDQQCVSNSECNATPSSSTPFDSTCACKEGYTSTPEGLCKNDYSEPCTPTFQQCNSYRGLTCKNYTCACIDEDTCYDKEQKMCVSYVGQPCGLFSLWYDEYDIGCIKNAECTSIKEKHHMSNFTTNHSGRVGSTSRKVCKCKAGFKEASMESDGKQCVPMNSIHDITDYDYSIS